MNNTHILAIAAVVLVIAGIIITHRRRRENFSLGNIFGKIKKTAVNTATTVASTVTGAYGMARGAFVQPRDMPQYTTREWTGKTWSCPEGSVDMAKQGAEQCLVSELGPMIWKADDNGAWSWICPRGTTPNNSPDWENKCIKGLIVPCCAFVLRLSKPVGPDILRSFVSK